MHCGLHAVLSMDALSLLLWGKSVGALMLKGSQLSLAPPPLSAPQILNQSSLGVTFFSPLHCQLCPFHLFLLPQGLREVAGTGAGVFVKEPHVPTPSNDIPACLPPRPQEKDRGMALLPCTEGGGFELGFLITRVCKSPQRS